MISKFFIDRPVLSNVLAIVMVLIGTVALFTLPVAQYPNIVPPTVQVTTSYPGASAQTVIDSVALPIELQVNGVDRMLYMQSTSTSSGTYTLTVTFQIGTDLDFAQVLVQNRVSAALAGLPTAVQAQGVTVQKKSTAILQIVNITSTDDKADSLYLSNYATINLINEVARIPGVGNANVFGVGKYAMRIWLDPQKLQSYGLVPQNVIEVVKGQSQQVAAGQVGAPPVLGRQDFQYTVDIQGRLENPDEFADIVVKADSANGGRLIRLRDVGRIELGAQTYSQTFHLSGRQAAGIAIYLTPNANALAVAGAVRARMEQLAKNFPPGMTFSVPFDTTKFVAISIHEVYKTLIEAGILVLLVILLFLQDWRAVLVPATTIPVTIIGAFAFMAALGFTVNMSTLFGIVLAIGIVVDDAIVIVEGVAKHIEAGLSPHDAAVKAMDELFGPIIGITLVLMSVFIPAAFLPGLTGQMFAQFALVIAGTALLSAINALSLKPSQCATFLRQPTPPAKRHFIFRGFNAIYDPFERAYARLIGAMVHHSRVMVVLSLAIAGLGLWGVGGLPTAFIPNEDQGYLIIALQLPDGAALGRTDASLHEAAQIALGIPGVDQVIQIAGVSVLDNNASVADAGLGYVILKDWGDRGKHPGQDLRSIYDAMAAALTKLTDGRALLIPPPPIQGIGNAGGFAMQLQQRDGSFDYAKLQAVTQGVVDAANSQSGLARVFTSLRTSAPQLAIEVDRVKAETLQVPVGDVFSALSSYLGSTYVNQFNKFGLTLQVYVQADSRYRQHPEDVLRLQVRNQAGQMVPIGALARIAPSVGPSLISLYNLYLSSNVAGSPAPGFSSGQAMDLMTQIARAVMPAGMSFEWTAMSFQEAIVGNQLLYTFALSILLVYLCLAGQYESWILPLAVIAAVPLSLLGPWIALSAVGLPNNLYTQIGLMLLIALSAKNAILIVEVAREERLLHGRGIVEAAEHAARVRFRPILMTSLAFILGVLPLVLSHGAGAAARVSLGLCVFSGMIASTCLAVLFVPSFFVVLQRLSEHGQAAAPVVAPAE